MAEAVLSQIIDWLYGEIMGFLSDFFTLMNSMGAELFSLPWVEAVTLFFGYLAWTLYAAGIVVGVFECAVEYQSGRGSIRDTAMNFLKGFLAVSLFNVVPIRLYSLCVSLQGSFGQAITGIQGTDGSISVLARGALNGSGIVSLGNPLVAIFCLLLMGYAVIKVFFANIKRGGILLIQIAVGSLYLFSVPRGYLDGFTQWCKQIVGLCLTTFLQATILEAGLMVFNDHILLGIGLMLSSTEVPRIAGQFGLDTSMKANLMSGVYAAQNVVNITKSITRSIAK